MMRNRTLGLVLAIALTAACSSGSSTGGSQGGGAGSGGSSGTAGTAGGGTGGAGGTTSQPKTCSFAGTPASLATECAPGEVCRHVASGESYCLEFGPTCADSAECCSDCTCGWPATCIEDVIVNFATVTCDTDADCPYGGCITRSFGNKICAFPGTMSGSSGTTCSSDAACGECNRCVDGECRFCGYGPAGLCTC